MERSNFLVAIIMLILGSPAIIPGWFVSLDHEIVTFPFIMEIWGKQERFFHLHPLVNMAFVTTT